MLLLTRRVGESIMIGDNVVISIAGVKGSQVRIGITAPKEVAVHREEIYERIHGASKASHQDPSHQGQSHQAQSHQGPSHQADSKGWIRAANPSRHLRGSGGGTPD